MAQLTDDQIWKIFESYLSRDKVSHYRRADIPMQFTLDDFVGKTICGHRKIRNPSPYNPRQESPNPEYFDVLEFSDGSILLTERWGDLECVHLHQYYYNGEEVLATAELFGGL